MARRSDGRELFELTMLGGASERNYRRMRPDIERVPWGTLDPRAYPEPLVLAARRSWTLAAYQEHRTGAACAETLRALIAARAPLDLIAFASRFPLDEMAHVEMCARLAGELGGGTPVLHDPAGLIPQPSRALAPLLYAADLVVRFFCVGEAISIPLLRGTWHAARHPLVKAVLGRIVKDEAAHGQFGWMFLDWAGADLTAADRAHLAGVARDTIRELTRGWDAAPPRPAARVEDVNALGWMESVAYDTLARRSLRDKVVAPLRARGIDPEAEPAALAPHA